LNDSMQLLQVRLIACVIFKNSCISLLMVLY
jgi:hypothetical protein